MELSGQRVLVVGSGISGIGAVSLLRKMKALPILHDGNEKLELSAIREKLGEDETPILLGTLPEQQYEETDVLLLSPGVPTDLPWIDRFREMGVPVIGEIELGFYAEQGKVIAITGTNGKTTTTTLVGEIMKADRGVENVLVVGNIGTPYTLEVEKTSANTVTVAEISSFQLETTDTFCPHVSAILNVTPDHLNRHHTMEGYAGAKEKITSGQTKDQVCVLNYENEYTRAFGETKCPARPFWFSSKRPLEEGIYLEGDEIILAENGEHTALLDIHKDMNLVGICNVENVMAAIAMTHSMNVPMDTIKKAIKAFRAVEHRIEYVATKRGVDYFNDSKGTNPDAAIQGIRAMSKPTILIGGGYDKQSEYDEWIEAFDGKVKLLVLIGQTRDKIAECARKHGIECIRMADSFEECLEICTEAACPGDAVLLSPACASWGMFPNYEVRGQLFKEYVRGLSEV